MPITVHVTFDGGLAMRHVTINRGALHGPLSAFLYQGNRLREWSINICGVEGGIYYCKANSHRQRISHICSFQSDSGKLTILMSTVAKLISFEFSTAENQIEMDSVERRLNALPGSCKYIWVATAAESQQSCLRQFSHF